MPKIVTVNSNNTSYTITDGLVKKSYPLKDCNSVLIPNLDGSKTLYLLNSNETIAIVSNTTNTEFTGNSIFGSTNPDIAQTNIQTLIGISGSSSSSSTPAVRVLTNAGSASYTQVYLQSLYDGQTGSPAPDTVPQAVTDYASTLNTSGYKVYLGQNTWWYTNSVVVTAASWTTFGGTKSAFGASIVPTGIITFK